MTAPNANAARPVVVERVKIRITATRTIERELTRYADTMLIDRMHHSGQLSDRQFGAAARLQSLFQGAGCGGRTTSRYGDSPRSDGECDEDVTVLAHGVKREDDETPAQACLRVYRRLLRDAGPVVGPVLDALMHDQHPGVRWLTTCQDGLDLLGDEWGMER